MVIILDYEYTETESKDVEPGGTDWEYWSNRTVKDEADNIIVDVAVWRREVKH